MGFTSLLPSALIHAPLAYAVVDRSGRVQEGNPAFHALLAEQGAEVEGRALVEVLGGDAAELDPAWQAIAAGIRSEVTLALRAPLAEGSKQVRLHVWPVPKRGARPPPLLVQVEPRPIALHDQTARRRALDALHTSEAKYRWLFQHSLDGILLTKPDGSVLSANPAACELLGRSEAEICAGGRSALVAPEDDRLAAMLEERARIGKVRAELLMVRKDGTRFPAEIASSVFRDGDGEALNSLIFRDLTGGKQAQEALQFLVCAGQELGGSLDYEKTLDALTRLVVPRMADLCIVDLVEGAQTRRVALAHRDPGKAAKLLNRRFSLESFHPQVGIARVIQTQQPELVREISEEWLREAIRDSDHLGAALEVRPRSAMHVPLVEHGQTLGALTLALVGDNPRRFTPEDLPLAKGLADRAAQAINHARLFASAVEAKQVRDDVLAVVSHDLRNPLYTISLCTEILTRRQPSPQLEVIRCSVGRAERLIDDLLVASALESGTLPLEREPEPVVSLVQEAISLHRAQAEDRAIRIVSELDEALPPVSLDRHRMLQLLSNLVGNALKFTPKGGQVVVGARRLGDELELSVRDTGPGICPEELPHVFERFWRGAHANRAGMGLGLSIAKGIAEAHGGRIRVESAPSAGARFVVTVPLGVSPAQAADLS